MALKMVLFDLDGTLLPMDQDKFVKSYFGLLAKKMAGFGYKPDALIDGVWKGTGAMVKNNGAKTNESVFWETFAHLVKENAAEDIPIFEEFYRVDFQNVKDVCGCNPNAAKAVKRIKDMGLRTALATNPIFPSIATESRIKWAGLSPSDFEKYTSYENSHFCKPNPKYFAEVIEDLGVEPDECLMVGNDLGEDTPAESLGMKVFIVTDCLIEKSGVSLDDYPHGGFDELAEYVEEIMEK